MNSDMGTQLSPNVSARKAHKVLAPRIVCPLDGAALYAILVAMMISKIPFLDGFYFPLPRRKQSAFDRK
jgi:hypothetical protein